MQAEEVEADVADRRAPLLLVDQPQRLDGVDAKRLDDRAKLQPADSQIRYREILASGRPEVLSRTSVSGASGSKRAWKKRRVAGS